MQLALLVLLAEMLRLQSIYVPSGQMPNSGTRLSRDKVRIFNGFFLKFALHIHWLINSMNEKSYFKVCISVGRRATKTSGIGNACINRMRLESLFIWMPASKKRLCFEATQTR
jgi:hypothetical protein